MKQETIERLRAAATETAWAHHREVHVSLDDAESILAVLEAAYEYAEAQTRLCDEYDAGGITLPRLDELDAARNKAEDTLLALISLEATE